MGTIAILGIMLLLAVVVEGLVEYFAGKPFDNIAALTPFKWTLPYIAAVVGVAGAFNYQLDLFSTLGDFLGRAVPVSALGIVLTGLAVGRGSNYLHDVVKRFFVKPAPLQVAEINAAEIQARLADCEELPPQ